MGILCLMIEQREILIQEKVGETERRVKGVHFNKFVCMYVYKDFCKLHS